MTRYQSPFSALPDEHMRLVGIISAHWEFMAVTIQRTLAEVALHDYARVAQFTENIPFRALMELLMAYARPLQESKPEVWKEFAAISQAVQVSYGLRNKYVHARWKAGDVPDLPYRVVTRSSGGKFKIADEPTCTCQMASGAQAIHDTGQRFIEFFQQFDLLKT